MNAALSLDESYSDAEVENRNDVEVAQAKRLNSLALLNKREVAWLGVFLVTQIAFLVCSVFLPMSHLPHLSTKAAFAFMVAESTLAAIWLSLGPGPLAARIVVTPLWLLACASFNGLANRFPQSYEDFLILECIIVTVITLILQSLRWRYGLQIIHRNGSTDPQTFQFRIIDWVSLTVSISLIIAFNQFADKTVKLGFRDIVISTLTGISWGIAILPAIFLPLWQTTFTRLFGGMILGLTLTAMISVGIALLTWQLLVFVKGLDPLLPLFLGTVPVFAWVLIVGSLLMIRSAGLRLTRRSLT
jgi:hypothetical protein